MIDEHDEGGEPIDLAQPRVAVIGRGRFGSLLVATHMITVLQERGTVLLGERADDLRLQLENFQAHIRELDQLTPAAEPLKRKKAQWKEERRPVGRR